MRSLIFIFIAIFSTSSLQANNVAPVVKTVNATSSIIKWEGKKVLGSHQGNINVKNGTLTFEENMLTGGMLVVDMSSLNCIDLKPGEGKEKLEAHLKSDDFFGVAAHPEAKLNITKVISRGKEGEYKIIANLTIKNITKEVKFDAVVLNGQGTAKIIIDRTDYDVKYRSGSFIASLGDKTIYDEFELDINLKF